MSVNGDEQRSPWAQGPRWVGYVVTLLLEAALTALLVLLMPVFPIGRYPIPYVLLTMTVAYLFAEGPAILSIFLGWFLFTYFFVPPTGLSWPVIHSAEGGAQQVALLLGVIVVGAAMMQARRSNRRIQRLADELTDLNENLRDEIAERRQTERALRESETQLRTIVDNLAEGLVVSDLEGNLVQWNHAAVQMHGFANEDEGRRQLLELANTFELSAMDGTVLPLDQWPLARILRGQHLRDIELRIRRINTDWRRVFSYGGTIVRVAEDQPLLAMVTISDITERKLNEEEIRRFSEELEQRVAQRTAELEAVNRELEASNKELESFSYSVSHDLRTPLRAIDGFSNTLLKHYHDVLDERGQDYLQRVRAAANRMGQLIDDILGLSRAGRAEMHRRSVDLSAMAAEVLGEFQNLQPERKAEVIIAPDLIVNADAHLLRIVLNNLLGNAWKFTSKRDTTRIEIGAVEQNSERVYFVRDNGAGFNPAYADKLFSPFQRLHTESDFPGTGIGLALVQRILRRHGGKIWAESAVDQGATFYFTLGDANR